MADKEIVSNRIPAKSVTPKATIILSSKHPDLLFLNPNNVVIKDGQSFVYDKYIATAPSSSSELSGEIVLEGQVVLDPETGLPVINTVDMTDIESVTFQEYLDASTGITKYNAIVKIRNTSETAADVVGVDARLYDAATSSYVIAPTTDANNSISASSQAVPVLNVPSVYFDRTGSAIAWGWNNPSGLTNTDYITFEWVVTTTAAGGTVVGSGTINYAASGSYQVGNSGKFKRYLISSANGDIPASSSARWLKVRTVYQIPGGKRFMSAYSTPI